MVIRKKTLEVLFFKFFRSILCVGLKPDTESLVGFFTVIRLRDKILGKHGPYYTSELNLIREK